MIQIRENLLMVYTLPVECQKGNSQNFQTPSYSGQVTDHTRKRAMRAIDMLLQKSPERIIYNPVSKNWHPFRINFITLTISDKTNICAADAYQNLLKPYLRKLRKYGRIPYVWKAELQQRGQLHYHITTNCFIPCITKYDIVCFRVILQNCHHARRLSS